MGVPPPDRRRLSLPGVGGSPFPATARLVLLRSPQPSHSPHYSRGLTSISIASGSAPQRQGSPTLPNPRDTTSSDERNEKSPSSRQNWLWRIIGGQGIAEILSLAAPHCWIR